MMDQAVYQLTVHEVGNSEEGQPRIRLESPHIAVVIIGSHTPAMISLCRAFAQHLGQDVSTFFKFEPEMPAGGAGEQA